MQDFQSLFEGVWLFSSEKALRETLTEFENAYLSRSLSRLFDPINLVFTSSNCDPPTSEEVDNIVKTISRSVLPNFSGRCVNFHPVCLLTSASQCFMSVHRNVIILCACWHPSVSVLCLFTERWLSCALVDIHQSVFYVCSQKDDYLVRLLTSITQCFMSVSSISQCFILCLFTARWYLTNCWHMAQRCDIWLTVDKCHIIMSVSWCSMEKRQLDQLMHL